MIKKIMTSLLIVLVMVAVQAQPDIVFMQDKPLELYKTGDDYFNLRIKAEPFVIEFGGDELHVATGPDEDLFTYTKADTDINADFNSYFFIFKYIAMSGDAEFLPMEKDAAAALNRIHGAKVGKKKSTFKVNALQVDSVLKPLANFEMFYMALWLDANKDQFIDEEELLKVKVIVE